MDLILLAAGASSRYNTPRPKYWLTMYDGRFMIEHAIEPFLDQVDHIHVVILEEHEQWVAQALVRKGAYKISKDNNFVIIEDNIENIKPINCRKFGENFSLERVGLMYEEYFKSILIIVC